MTVIFITVGIIFLIGGMCSLYEDMNQTPDLAAAHAEIEQLQAEVKEQSDTLETTLAAMDGGSCPPTNTGAPQ